MQASAGGTSGPERMGCVELNAEPVLRKSWVVVLLSMEARPFQPEGTADLNAGSRAVGVQPECSKQDAEKESLQNRVLKDHIQQERQGLPRALKDGGTGPPLSRLFVKRLRSKWNKLVTLS